MSPPSIRIAVLVTAAGSSSRFGGGKKELRKIGGASILDRSVFPFIALPGLEALVVTSPPGLEDELLEVLSPSTRSALDALGPGRFAIVAGGESRRDSVRLGLERLAAILGGPEGAAGAFDTPKLDEIVALVHDGARPWARAELARRVAAGAAERGACVPIVSLVDTPKELGADGTLSRHPSRASLGGVQTPQGFRLGSLLAAHRRAAAESVDCTDDAELWDRYVGPVAWVPGEEENRKVTYARDLGSDPAFRIGQGWDLHRLVAGRRLLLGGVELPSDKGEEAHSDGDVLLHAIIDALLGAAALGDIGTHFPPSDAAWKDADSRDLAGRAVALVREGGWEIGNLDCTVVLERPKLGSFREAIRESVAACLGIDIKDFSLKAKTKEGVDAVGEGRAVEAFAAVSLFRRAFGPDEER